MASSRSLLPPPGSARTRLSSGRAAGDPARFAVVLHTRLEDAAASWLDLQSRGICTAYQRFDWVCGIVADIMPEAKADPLLVEIRDVEHDELVMLLPLARHRRLGHRVITWLDLGVCDYAAPLVAAGFTATAEQVAGIWAAVRRALPRADLIAIDRIPHTVGRIPNPLALLAGIRPMPMVAHGLRIDGPPETLLQRICSASTNQKFRKADRRLAREGDVRFVVAGDADTAAAVFGALLDQRRQRFRDLGRFDLLDRPDVRDFYRKASLLGLANGCARLFGLSVNGRWIATALGLVHDGTFHGILLAMDTEWRRFSPGVRIITEIMVWARHHEIDYFDFTIGDLPYKAELGAQSKPLLEFSTATSPRGILILLGARAGARLRAELQKRRAIFDNLRKTRRTMRRWTMMISSWHGSHR